MPARWNGPWWANGCICQRVGLRPKTGVRRRVLQVRVAGRGCGGEAGLPVEDPIGVGDAAANLGAGPSTDWLRCRDDPFGMSPSCYVAVLAGRADGHWATVRTGRSGGLWGVAAGTCAHQHGIPGPGCPHEARLVGKQRRTTAGRSDELPEEPWREVTVARGMPGSPQPPVHRSEGAFNQQA